MSSQSKKEKLLCLSKNERKVKLHLANREFIDEVLNVVKIQAKMENIWSINEQQMIEIDELYDIF